MFINFFPTYDYIYSLELLLGTEASDMASNAVDFLVLFLLYTDVSV